MSPKIEVDNEVYRALKDLAEPFVDTTPNDVLRRQLLGPGPRSSREQDRPATKAEVAEAPVKGPRTRTTSKGRHPARKRASSKDLLPEEAYELPILAVLERAGGWLPTSEAVAQVGRIVEPDLTPKDREKISSGRFRWEMRAQFARHRMVSQGLLKKDSARGVWEISEQGQKKLAKAGTNPKKAGK